MGRIHLTLAEELLEKIDTAAAEQFANRSEFIRQAIHEKLQVINEGRARLGAAAKNADVPTEEEIFDLLRLKQRQRAAAKWRRDMRRRQKGQKFEELF